MIIEYHLHRRDFPSPQNPSFQICEPRRRDPYRFRWRADTVDWTSCEHYVIHLGWCSRRRAIACLPTIHSYVSFEATGHALLNFH